MCYTIIRDRKGGIIFMVKREMYMKRIRPFIGTDLIKVMTGIRRSGKSVMLELIKQELIDSGVSSSQFISINFEDMRYTHLQTAKALYDEISSRSAGIDGKIYLFFDYLAGRYVEFIVYPFSFAEFLELYHSVFPEETVQKSFQQYILYGGMPYLANIRYADEPSRQYLQDLFNSVQLKDIVKRNKIRDVDLLERIMAYVMANVGNTFSASSLAKFLKSEQRTVAPETILNYIRYCCDACFQ